MHTIIPRLPTFEYSLCLELRVSMEMRFCLNTAISGWRKECPKLCRKKKHSSKSCSSSEHTHLHDVEEFLFVINGLAHVSIVHVIQDVGREEISVYSQHHQYQISRKDSHRRRKNAEIPPLHSNFFCAIHFNYIPLGMHIHVDLQLHFPGYAHTC